MEDAIHMSCSEVEKDLIFARVLNFENRLQEETIHVINRLRAAGVDSVMLTGDSLLTGVHVAKESTIIPYAGLAAFTRAELCLAG
jgi:P-type E1-E2 ATPase